MNYISFHERSVAFLDKDGLVLREFGKGAKFVSSIEISGNVAIPNGYVSMKTKEKIEEDIKSAVASNGPNEIGIVLDIQEKVAELGLESSCEIDSMKRIIYPLGEKVSEFYIKKPKNKESEEKGND